MKNYKRKGNRFFRYSDCTGNSNGSTDVNNNDIEVDEEVQDTILNIFHHWQMQHSEWEKQRKLISDKDKKKNRKEWVEKQRIHMNSKLRTKVFIRK